MDTDIRVAVLIQKEDKFLLGQEATSIIYGLWNWQQGKVENGESLEKAAVREVKEETGLEVSLVRKLTVINNPFAGTKKTHVYLGEIISGEISYAEDEILDLRWFTKEEIFAMRSQLSGPWVIKVIETYL